MTTRHTTMLRRSTLSLILASLFVSPAWAQTSDDAVTPPASGTAKGQADAAVTAVTIVGKRGQTAANTAGGVSSITGAALEKMGADSFGDYLSKVPGVVFNEGPTGNSTAVIRGVGTTAGLDQGQGTTGYYINEIPLTEPGYAMGIPDIDTFDVDHVEVLRGPQGSLFGAASLGGAINYVAKEADASGFDAAAETEISQTKHSPDVSYTGKVMLNVPIIDKKLAARLVIGRREKAGYLDNIGLNQEGSNSNTMTDGRFSVVWTPDAKTRLSWLTLWQKSQADDASYQMIKYGELNRTSALPVTAELDFALNSLRLERDFDVAKLTAIASYNRKAQMQHFDYTLSSTYRNFRGTSGPQLFRQSGDSHTRNVEVRLASPNGGRFEWLVGTSYQKTDKTFYEDISAGNAYAVLSPRYQATGQLRGNDYYWGVSRTTGSDKSVFGEASINFLDDWKLTVGGRRYDTELLNINIKNGVNYPGSTVTGPSPAAETGFTPKISLSYKASPDTLYYATASEGFRFGGINTARALAGFNTPASYGSDSLRNYEIGMKSSLLNRRLSFDADIFDIEWSDLQVRLYRPDLISYATNAGKARIRGFEFASNWRATDELTLSANYTWMDAKLTQDLLNATVPLHAGQQLPGSSKNQLSATASYAWNNNKYTPNLSLSGHTMTGAPADLQGTGEKINGFTTFDTRYAMWFDNVEASLYVNNLTDKRGITFSYGNTAAYGLQQFVIRPRTLGLRLSWKL
jgi:iron complex outermembrane receptor protein